MRKRVTSKDVAEKAAVSRTTVSLVLNNVGGIQISPETRQRVIDAANELGYVPDATAQALASRRAKAIGLVMTRSPHHIASDTFLPQILSGMMDVVKDNKLRLLFEYVEEEHQEYAYLELARSKHIDGMILLTPRLDDSGLRKLEEVEIPTVLMGEIEGSNFYTVDVDNHLAAQKAVEYLIELGHTQIACITNAPATYTASPDRVRGYKSALSNAGIKPDDDLIRYADFTPESGYNSMKSLLALPKNSQQYLLPPIMLPSVESQPCLRQGLRIPDDISLVGFDDIPWAQFSNPPLTTVHLQAQELARRACLVLMDLLKGKEPETKRQIVDTQLVVRKSCRRL